ncbi:MAG TPA: hypothetical protein VLV78_08010 [Thermoanaerobaculia bacterium]|nr:hypothetical protein [Thermoanaerobaculia bacterium]
MAEPKNKSALAAFMKNHSSHEDPESATRDELVTAMEELDKQLLKQLFHKTAEEIDKEMPLYFWMADRREAIFSIPSLSEKALEWCFATTDRALLEALLDVRGRWRK